ncbi:type III-B CRISPR module RAMP protein Cmr6 [Pseudothermotoga thermarum]|uniref:CRISPR-associated RAMP protein, Cmr6 family n=1 Tax=Pseudothermotoga thermarum DSM 5069 TaxID=688269 RepID=F7YTM6_9THEM|nr:type III-B CRISPR module RAMP protein Cmr6 [Pseudothermotoga thermarum]AEH51248.1 CRISPR-associated RAMP protein, Cmr6 family [Pseudothermotoga thermarum DSM 5069]
MKKEDVIIRDEIKSVINKIDNFAIDNFALRFRFPEITESEKKGERKIKIEIINDIDKVGKSIFTSQKSIISDINERRKKSILTLEKFGYKVIEFTAKPCWRMVVGLGGTHPQETSMILHHVYGFPYIPGSSIKGVTRSMFILDWFEKVKKALVSENIDLSKFVAGLENYNPKSAKNQLPEYYDRELVDLYSNIFGTQEYQGKVIFFDAFPVGEINLVLDIINPHYPDYYSGNKPPADYQNPNPIKFLTVANTNFLFVLAGENEKIVIEAERYLKQALQAIGIGAKTSLGYGLFEIL